MAAGVLGDLVSQAEWIFVQEELNLSPQQAQIVRCLLQAKADKQIARDMGISTATVRTHMSRLFQKLGANDRVELVLQVLACLRAADRDNDLQVRLA